MMTPAATALVMLTPNSMQIENRKLPRNDSTKSKRLVLELMGISVAGFLSQCSIAAPPMPKRNQASKKTGMTAISEFAKQWPARLESDNTDGPRASNANWLALANFCHAILNSAEFSFID